MHDAMSLYLGKFKMLSVVFCNKRIMEKDVFLYTQLQTAYLHVTVTIYMLCTVCSVQCILIASIFRTLATIGVQRSLLIYQGILSHCFIRLKFDLNDEVAVRHCIKVWKIGLDLTMLNMIAFSRYGSKEINYIALNL